VEEVAGVEDLLLGAAEGVRPGVEIERGRREDDTREIKSEDMLCLRRNINSRSPTGVLHRHEQQAAEMLWVGNRDHAQEFRVI
jgi:hypothetical protein